MWFAKAEEYRQFRLCSSVLSRELRGRRLDAAEMAA